LADRMLERLIPRGVAAAGCPTEHYWGPCEPPDLCGEGYKGMQWLYVVTQSCAVQRVSSRCC
jgi:hypothetical protein